MSNFEHRITEDSTEFEKAFLKIYDGSLWTALNKMKDWQPPKELAEVPQFFADWFENQLKNNELKKFDGNDVFRIIQDVIKVSNGESTWGDYDITDEIAKFAEDNEELFLNLIVNCSLGNGYTVEKEQMYEVIINGLYLVKLMKYDDSKSHRFIEKDKLVNWQETGYRLTAKQIKMIDERYMAFAVKVDEADK